MKPFIKSFLLLAIAVFAMTSCEKTDDISHAYSTLTDAQKQEYYATINGDYLGKMYFWNDSTKKDSVTITWNASQQNKTVTYRQFPVSKLSGYLQLTTNIDQKELEIDRAIVRSMKNIDLVCNLNAPSNEMTEYMGTYYRFGSSPVERSQKFVNEKQDSVIVSFSDQITNGYQTLSSVLVLNKNTMACSSDLLFYQIKVNNHIYRNILGDLYFVSGR